MPVDGTLLLGERPDHGGLGRFAVATQVADRSPIRWAARCALLTLAAYTTIPDRQLLRLAVGQLRIADGVATVTDQHGKQHISESTTDPTLRGPYALMRWRCVLDTEVTHKRVTKLLKDAKEVTAASHHSCQAPQPFDDRTLDVLLFPPINQWGQMPFPSSRSARTPPPGSRGRPTPACPTTECWTSTSPSLPPA